MSMRRALFTSQSGSVERRAPAAALGAHVGALVVFAALMVVGCAGAGSEKRADDTACEVFALLECENQVLGLADRVTGTTFDLVYASDRIPGRTTTAAWDARAYGLGGWTLSVHHRFDSERGIVFFGDGRTVRVGKGIRFDETKPTGLLVASEDGSEAYLFDANGATCARSTPSPGPFASSSPTTTRAG